jgi:hypothetical protein
MARIAYWRRQTYWLWQQERQKRHNDTGVPGVMPAGKGTFLITGYDANLRVGRTPLAANTGAVAITGVDATLTYSGAGAGTNFTAVRISHLQW